MSAESPALVGKKHKVAHYFDFSDTTIVILKVGPEGKPYNIHRELLCQRSLYFHNAFKGEFREAGEREISLEDTSCRTFEDVMRWMYSGRLQLNTRLSLVDKGDIAKKKESTSAASFLEGVSEEPKSSDEDESTLHVAYVDDDNVDDNELDLQYAAFLDIYIFGDKYDLPDLRFAALTVWQRLDVEHVPDDKPRASLIKKAFANLPERDHLRRYLLRYCAMRWSGDWIKAQAQSDLPYEFMLGVMRHMANLRQRPSSSSQRWFRHSLLKMWCTYHEHDEKNVPGECVAEKDGLMLIYGITDQPLESKLAKRMRLN